MDCSGSTYKLALQLCLDAIASCYVWRVRVSRTLSIANSVTHRVARKIFCGPRTRYVTEFTVHVVAFFEIKQCCKWARLSFSCLLDLCAQKKRRLHLKNSACTAKFFSATDCSYFVWKVISDCSKCKEYLAFSTFYIKPASAPLQLYFWFICRVCSLLKRGALPCLNNLVVCTVSHNSQHAGTNLTFILCCFKTMKKSEVRQHLVKFRVPAKKRKWRNRLLDHAPNFSHAVLISFSSTNSIVAGDNFLLPIDSSK